MPTRIPLARILILSSLAAAPSLAGQQCDIESTYLSTLPLDAGGTVAAVAAAGTADSTELHLATHTPRAVRIYRSIGNGRLVGAATADLGADPLAIAVADMNGDGSLDSIVSNVNDELDVLLQFDRRITRINSFDTGRRPVALAVGSFDGDQHPDIIAVNELDDDVSVLLNQGNGNLFPQQRFTVASAPNSVDVADVNGDGFDDVVVSNGDSNSVTMLINDRTGGFTRTDYNVGPSPVHVQFTDLNEDGELDYITANAAGGSVSIGLGRGDGSFQHATHIATRNGAEALALGDLNADGLIDAAVLDVDAGRIEILLGDGTGSLRSGLTFQRRATLLAARDLTADGRDELIVDNDQSQLLHVLRLRTATDPSMDPVLLEAPLATRLLVGDIEGDGDDDFIVSTRLGRNQVARVYLNEGGVYQAQQDLDLDISYRFPMPRLIDVNADGRLDLVTADNRLVLVRLAGADGTFDTVVQSPLQLDARQFDIGHIDGDGLLDLIVFFRAVGPNEPTHYEILRGVGDGSFTPGKVVIDENLYPYDIRLFDLEDDGIAELLHADAFELEIWRNVGGRYEFEHSAGFSHGFRDSLHVVDVNGDGTLDLVLHSGRYIQVLLNDGQGSLSTAFEDEVLIGGSLAVGDVDADGLPDLVLHAGDHGTQIRLGDGTGAFPANHSLTLAGGSAGVGLLFARGSGPDIAVTGDPHAGVTITRNACDTCPADLDDDGDVNVNDFFLYLDLFALADYRADIDSDGKVDAEDFFGYLDLFAAGC